MKQFKAVLEPGLENLNFEILCKSAERLMNTTFARSPNEHGGINLLMDLSNYGIHIALGSACGQLSLGPSRLLKMLDRTDDGQNYIRISQWGYYNAKDAEYVLDIIQKCIS